MSYSPEEFDDVRKLLACKKHEVPPPGYFHRFSEKVIARIQEEDATAESGWWQWLVSRFDARPFWACAYGFAVSSLLLMGFRLSQMFEREALATQGPSGPWLAATPDPTTFQSSQFQAHLANPGGLASFSSVSPLIDVEPQATRFVPSSHVRPVNFKFGH